MIAAASLEPVPRKKQPSREELEVFHQALLDIIDEVRPATVRQVFYRAVGPGIVQKTEQEYRRVQHALSILRESGRVAWDDVIDGTRAYMKPDSWANPADALEDAARSYRKNLWAAALVIPEIWIEKDALSGRRLGRDRRVGRAPLRGARLLLPDLPAPGSRADRGAPPAGATHGRLPPGRLGPGRPRRLRRHRHHALPLRPRAGRRGLQLLAKRQAKKLARGLA